MLDPDRLFERLTEGAARTTHLLVENAMRDYGKEQAVLCFLDRYKMFLERADLFQKDGWRWDIRLKQTTGETGWAGYAELSGAYTENYYLTDCGGYDEFRRSGGMDISRRLREVCQLVGPAAGERILDVGCGRGELTFALAESGAEVEGVDYAEAAIALAERTFGGKCERVHYLHADIFKMDHLEMFDKIVMADVVEHIEQEVLEQIFAKIAGAMRRTGVLIVHTAPNRDYYEITYPGLREQAAGLGCWKPREPRSYYEQLMHINEQTPDSLARALRRYFDHVRVWTGSVGDIETDKTPEERYGDNEIFAVACHEEVVLQERIAQYTKKQELSECQIRIEAADVVIPLGEQLAEMEVTLLNTGRVTVCAGIRYPLNLSYHILDRNDNMVVFDGERTPVWHDLLPDVPQKHRMRVVVPEGLDRASGYRVRVTLVAERLFWFDQEGGNRTDVCLSFEPGSAE